MDSRAVAALLGFLRESCRDHGQTVVTHDPIAASSAADRAPLIGDGRLVDELDGPGADTAPDAMRGPAG